MGLVPPLGRAATLRTAALLLALAAAPAAAQRDTVPRPPRRDSTQVAIPGEAVRADTLPGAKQDTTPPDSTVAAPAFADHPLPAAHGYSDAAWLLGPGELQYFHGLSLADLLDRIPGLLVTRSGGFGRPMGVSPFAAGGGRFRVFLDGYELRPLNSAVPDLQRIPLVNLRAVRIERGLDEIRVDLTSLRLADIRPLAMVEGMDGDLGSRALRGLFTRPIGRHWVGEIGLDVAQSGGARRRQKFSETSTVGRLSYAFNPDWGVQAELRTNKLNAQNDLSGSAGAGLVEALDRSDAVLRGRGLLLGRFHLEAMLGRSRQSPAGADTLTQAVHELQADARVTVPLRIGTLAAGARLHRGEQDSWVPNASELWGRLDFAPAPALAASGELRQLTIGGKAGLEASASLRAGPWGGLSLFGQLAAGSRPVRYALDTLRVVQTIAGIGGSGLPTLDTVLVREFRNLGSTLNGVRAGAEFQRGGYRLGGALIHHRLDQTAPFGVMFDRGAPLQPGLDASAVEAYASLPLLIHNLRFEGWFQRWLNAPDRVYLPTQLGRAALEFHGVYKTGNLEPTLRFEMVARDQSLVWDPTTGANRLLPRYAVFNWYVQVRIIDIRAFWRFENAFNQRGEYDVSQGVMPSGRALYGVRWYFRN